MRTVLLVLVLALGVVSEEGHRLIQSVALIVVGTPEWIALGPHIARDLVVPAFVHADVGVVLETGLVADRLVFDLYLRGVLVNNFLDQVVDHRLVLDVVLLGFNDGFGDEVSSRRCLGHVLHLLNAGLEAALADVPLEVFVSFASPEILAADNAENFVLDYCCVA